MKELFHNSQGFNTVCIKVESGFKTFDFYYHLSDNPVQLQWQKFHSESTARYKTNPLYKMSLETVSDILAELVEKKGYQLELPIKQSQLNKLHNEFVAGQGNDETWALINTYIHVAEDKLDPYNKYNSTLSFTLDPEPAYVDLKEEYKLWLTTEAAWGDLLMGYSTIGKPWEDIAQDDDDLTDLMTQSIITPEARLNFNVEPPYKKFTEKKFYDWAAVKQGVPLDDLNSLALGKYYLGKVIITDVFLDFHANASDWYVPNHDCKLRWNQEALQDDAHVVSVEFFESDMYMDTLLKHTGLDNA